MADDSEARPDPGRPTTLADVAAHAGVSVPLVSIVMRDAPGASAATRERVRRAAHELGYRPDIRARMLRRTRSRLIGVVFGVQHAFHGDLVSGLYAAADAADYELALSAVTPGRDERRAAASLLQDRCEALVLLGPLLPTSYLAEIAATIPVVVVARTVRHRGVDVIRTDDAAGLHQAVDHLVDLGHSRIAHIDGGRAPGAAERRRGYREALDLHRLAPLAPGRPPGASPRTRRPPLPELCSAPNRGPRQSASSTTAAPPGFSTCYAAPASRCLTTCPSSASTTAGWPACPTSRSAPSPRTR